MTRTTQYDTHVKRETGEHAHTHVRATHARAYTGASISLIRLMDERRKRMFVCVFMRNTRDV